jgi:hypothetical protein
MRRLFLLFLLGLFTSATVLAQPGEPKKSASNSDGKPKAEKDPEAERIIRERKDNARSLLISLAADAANFNDQRLRARTLARVADALWEVDAERARSMFRKAWDAAELMDAESRRITLEEIKQQQAKTGNAAVANRGNIRNEVLRLAARRDRKLGEELLAKLTAEKKEEAADAADKARSSLFDTPEAVTQRLDLARQLLQSDVERALQFADPALTSINRDAVDFLSYLREKDAAAADLRYSALLARAIADLQSDANTVSLLSSYLFTPHVFVHFDGGGASNTQTSRGSVPPQVSPELRAAFFRTASEILLRPLAPPGQDTTSSGLMGKYLMLKRLMPLFEQFAPKETAEALRAHMEALGNSVSQEARERDDDTLREGIRPSEKSEDLEKRLLDRIERTKTAEDRDQLYLQLAHLYSETGDLRARDAVEKISDSELRQAAHAFIDSLMMLRAVDKKETDRVLEMVRIGELTHVQKSWALAQAAKFVGKTDPEKALSLLEQADAEARRIEPSNVDRPRALMGVASALLTLDRAKAWDAASDATRAANSAEGFTGEDGVLRVSLITKGMASIRTSSARDFDVAPLFNALATEDYNRTVELARLFEREAPRASATIAIARAVLEEKKKP